MKQRVLPSAVAALMLAGAAVLAAGPEQAVTFSADERAAILAHGPWPPPRHPDPSNRVSGNRDAISLGRRLFFDTRLSLDGRQSCATCHDPATAFADGKPRGIGRALVDRNAIALANLGLNRWFGWAGAADSLWAQSIHPIVDVKELGLTAEQLRDRLAAAPAIAAAYTHLFQAAVAHDAAERVLVNAAKALAAFQETIVTGRTPFDDFRDALERSDTRSMAHYPRPAQRGLAIFVGKGNCTACHFGPNFTSGEFEDVGVPHFAEQGRVDAGRHGGIAALRASPFNLLSPYSDNADKAAGVPTRHVEQQHRNWGEFRVPSLRNVARTAPYMHNGSLATLQDVVRHYSELNEERLHGHAGRRLLRPLRLTPQEAADLVAFLETLSGEISFGP
ncbi:MAG: c-type cytochrome [Hyphomonadaceae bacterium]|nr:c-type cytochrome [Hyphomonadaceae bacterium]